MIGARPGAQRWNRDELFAAGALTLGELLAQVPGVTQMATGFLLGPTHLAWHGDPGGVRIVIDGIEKDDINPRNGGVTDFTAIPLWAFEELALEETAGELRVHARTWRVERTTASTRTDVLTGSENLNLFRGFFGKRSSKGVALQLAAQQSSSLSQSGMDGDALGAFARLGWSGGSWSIDGTVLRQGMTRSTGFRIMPGSLAGSDSVAAFHGATNLAYLRTAWRDAAGDGPWAQLTAAANGFSKSLPGSSSSSVSSPAVASDSGDTTASQGEYQAAVGLNRAGLRISGHLRARSRFGKLDMASLTRIEGSRAGVSFSGAVGTSIDGKGVWRARAGSDLRDWLRVSASSDMSSPSGGGSPRLATAGDVAIRFRDRWLSGGLRQVAAEQVLGAAGIDSVARGAFLPAGTAMAFAAMGPLTRGWRFQTEVTRWVTPTVYRPQVHARSRVWFESSFLDKLPGGNFHLYAALNHEYQTSLSVPGKGADLQSTRAASVFGGLLEIRIASAVLFWDYRNMSGLPYDTFPGFAMPRIASFYGIRWSFWN